MCFQYSHVIRVFIIWTLFACPNRCPPSLRFSRRQARKGHRWRSAKCFLALFPMCWRLLGQVQKRTRRSILAISQHQKNCVWRTTNKHPSSWSNNGFCNECFRNRRSAQVLQREQYRAGLRRRLRHGAFPQDSHRVWIQNPCCSWNGMLEIGRNCKIDFQINFLSIRTHFCCHWGRFSLKEDTSKRHDPKAAVSALIATSDIQLSCSYKVLQNLRTQNHVRRCFYPQVRQDVMKASKKTIDFKSNWAARHSEQNPSGMAPRPSVTEAATAICPEESKNSRQWSSWTLWEVQEGGVSVWSEQWKLQRLSLWCEGQDASTLLGSRWFESRFRQWQSTRLRFFELIQSPAGGKDKADGWPPRERICESYLSHKKKKNIILLYISLYYQRKFRNLTSDYTESCRQVLKHRC